MYHDAWACRQGKRKHSAAFNRVDTLNGSLQYLGLQGRSLEAVKRRKAVASARSDVLDAPSIAGSGFMAQSYSQGRICPNGIWEEWEEHEAA